MPKHIGFLSTVREWLDKARRDRGVFHSPPNRKPSTRGLKEGDIALIYLRDENVIAAECVVEWAGVISGKEFLEKYSSMSVEVEQAPFPKPEDKVTIVVYRDMKVYPRPIPVDEAPDIIRKVIGKWKYAQIRIWNDEFARALEELRRLGGLASQGRTGNPIKQLSKEKIERIAKKYGLFYSDDVIDIIVAALKSGKHLLLMGPPGTGKSMLARVIAEALGFELYSCTASSTWTRYDFIGGPVLGDSGKLVWYSGHFLHALARHIELSRKGKGGVLLLVEELNRCEADKVLAEFFSIYPSSDPNDWRFPEALLDEIERYGYAENDPARIILNYVKEHGNRVPSDFRVIATVNTFDQAYLFTLGHALQRRFIIVTIKPPRDQESEERLVYEQLKRRGVEEDKAEKLARFVVEITRVLREVTGKDIGQAVAVDAAILAYNMGAYTRNMSEKDLRKIVEKAVVHTALSQINLVSENASDLARELEKRGYSILAEAVRRLAA